MFDSEACITEGRAVVRPSFPTHGALVVVVFVVELQTCGSGFSLHGGILDKSGLLAWIVVDV